MTTTTLTRPDARPWTPAGAHGYGHQILDDATRREFLAGLAAAGLLAACGDGTGNDEAAGDRDGSYPRTVSHVRGELTIPARPERVVCLENDAIADYVFALGVEPVASPAAYDAGGAPNPWTPWPDSVQVLASGQKTNVELIASLEPDLIVLNAARYDDDLGDKLRGLAPVLPVETFGPWREPLRDVAEALARETEAEAVIADVDAQVSTTADKVRARAGDRTLAVIQADGGYFGYGTGEEGYLYPYGFVAPTTFEGVDFLEISAEQMEMADAHVIAVGGAETQALLAEPLFEQLPAARAGRVVELTGPELFSLYVGMARTPWAVANVVPKLLAPFEDS